jgi:hypothetical protein
MDIEHCDCLSWFLRKDKSHEQDGERLPPAAVPQTETASSDPAMAFEPSIGRTGDHSTRLKIGSVRRCRMNSGLIRCPLQSARTRRANPHRRIPSRSINDL